MCSSAKPSCQPLLKPQAKILRDPERPDAAGHPGGKSRGFGFVEFGDPSHALAALRQLNNNPTAFGSRDRCVFKRVYMLVSPCVSISLYAAVAAVAVSVYKAVAADI
jgi:RNA recognition motif-containing protein